MYDQRATQEWRRHDRAVNTIVAAIVVTLSALGIALTASIGRVLVSW